METYNKEEEEDDEDHNGDDDEDIEDYYRDELGASCSLPARSETGDSL